MKSRKRTAALVLAVCLILVIVPNHQAHARYTHTDIFNISLDFSGTTATCKTTVVGNSAVTRIEADLTLYRIDANGNDIFVASWNPSANQDYLTYTGTGTVIRGWTYKLVVTAKVTRGTTETISLAVERHCA